MNFEFTEEEKEKMRANIIERAEALCAQELLDQMRRTITREMLTKLYSVARKRLEEMLQEQPVQEALAKVIQGELGGLQRPNYQGRAPIREALDRAVLQVTEAHAKAVSQELGSMLYAALKSGFDKPPAKESEGSYVDLGPQG